MKTLSALLIGVALISFTTNEPIPRHNVFFAWNSSELSGSPARVVESVYKKLAAGKQIRFGITGPISNVHNTAEKNRITSERANNIVALLKKISAVDDAFEIVDVTNPYRSKPLDMAATEPFELEVLLTKVAAWVAPKFTSIDDYLPMPVQTFLIDPREDNRLVGEQGTVINIPANTLALKRGNVPVQMTVELKEVYGAGQIINADLHTASNGQMLETGGTVHLAANTGGSPAHISNGQAIDLEFPKDESEENEMQLFNGRVDRGGNFDWIEKGLVIERIPIVREKFYINEKEVSKEEYERRIRQWENRKAEAEREEKIQQLIAANDEAANAYLLSTDELGWINCDRFYDAEETTGILVYVDTTLHPSVRMVFDNIKSVMNGYYNRKNGTVSFTGIPVGETIRLVGYSIMEDVPYVANKTTVVKTNMKVDLPLSKTTKKEMETELASLN